MKFTWSSFRNFQSIPYFLLGSFLKMGKFPLKFWWCSQLRSQVSHLVALWWSGLDTLIVVRWMMNDDGWWWMMMDDDVWWWMMMHDDDDYDDYDDCDGDRDNDWYFLTELIVWDDEHCEMLMDKTLHQFGASKLLKHWDIIHVASRVSSINGAGTRMQRGWWGPGRWWEDFRARDTQWLELQLEQQLDLRITVFDALE